MKIVKKEDSKERCAESGWFAYDLILEMPLCKEDILSLQGIEGSFVYLSMLKKPFFKIEYDNYVIKGMEGDPFCRVALHKESLNKLDDIIKYIQSN